MSEKLEPTRCSIAIRCTGGSELLATFIADDMRKRGWKIIQRRHELFGTWVDESMKSGVRKHELSKRGKQRAEQSTKV